MKVKDCMCNHVNFVKPETTIKDCAKMMCENHIGCTPVCDCNNTLVGIVTDRDILLRAVACEKDTCKTPISEIMTTNIKYCDCNADIREAEKIMANEQIRRIPIVDTNNNNKVIGMLTLGDLASNKTVNTQEFCDTVENICNHNTKNCD